MIEKRWIAKPALQGEDAHLVAELTHTIHVDSTLATLLVQRGITGFDQAKDYFRPDLNSLHDPFLMKDMQKAVDRLAKAIQNSEKILVYGDYDVDGSTSVAMFYDFLRQVHTQVDYYVPDRYAEGYGISDRSIEFAHENGFNLIVTLDCGIKSVDKIAAAKELGIDYIICDHHRPGDCLPEAVAVLDPKRDDCPYPYKELTGCGVGFKLIQAFCSSRQLDQELALQYLDLLAISIASDIVPITGENRIMAFYGLQRINLSPRIGVKALIQIAGLTSALDITNVVFGLSPRINAAGRIKHAKEAVRLLLSDDEEQAGQFAREINQYNLDRRNFDTSITEEALQMIEGTERHDTIRSTVLFKQDWHKGVIGIVASRCIERFHRPTIIMTESHGKAAGSARSVPGFDIYEAIEECSDLLEQFGGHTFAAGLTLPIENIGPFRVKFEEVVGKRILPDQLIPAVDIDTELDLGQITPKFYNVLKQMAPFGPGNMSPVFVSYQVTVAGQPFLMKEKHIKIEVVQGNSARYTAVGFGMGHYYSQLKPGQTIAICYAIEQNTFRGNTTLQLSLKDIKI